MKTPIEFRNAVATTLGLPPQLPDQWLVQTAFGEARITLKPDAPAVLFRFTTPGEPWEQEAAAGINVQSGTWDIVPGASMPSAVSEREECLKILQRRLGLAGYVPPIGPLDPGLPADALIAAARATGDDAERERRRAKVREFVESMPPLWEAHLMDEGDNDDHPLWCVNAQIKGLMEGYGTTEDIDAVKDFLRATGLPESTAVRMRDALCHARFALTPDERSALLEVLREETGQTVAYPSGGEHAGMVARRTEVLRSVLAKLQTP